jgi:hypothetical protein
MKNAFFCSPTGEGLKNVLEDEDPLYSLFPKQAHDAIRKAIRLKELLAKKSPELKAGYELQKVKRLLEFEEEQQQLFKVPVHTENVSWGPGSTAAVLFEKYPVEIFYYGGAYDTGGLGGYYELSPAHSGIFLFFRKGLPVREETFTSVLLSLNWIDFSGGTRTAIINPVISVPSLPLVSESGNFQEFSWRIVKPNNMMLLCVSNKSEEPVGAYGGSLCVKAAL